MENQLFFIVEGEGSRLLQKFYTEDGRNGFLRDLGIYLSN